MKTVLFLALLLWPSMALAQSTQTARFNLSWTNGTPNSDGSNVPTGTKVERSLGTSGPWTQIGVVPWAGNTFQDVIAGDTGNKIYCYRARATNAAGDSPYSNTACGSTPPIIGTVGLLAPANLVAPLGPITKP